MYAFKRLWNVRVVARYSIDALSDMKALGRLGEVVSRAVMEELLLGLPFIDARGSRCLPFFASDTDNGSGSLESQQDNLFARRTFSVTSPCRDCHSLKKKPVNKFGISFKGRSDHQSWRCSPRRKLYPLSVRCGIPYPRQYIYSHTSAWMASGTWQ